jgi:hypothetical protein
LLLAALFGWLDRDQRDVIEFLREENRVLKMQLHGRRLRLSDDERRRLAVIGRPHGLPRSSRRTPFSDGIASWWRASGRTPLAERDDPVSGQRFGVW